MEVCGIPPSETLLGSQPWGCESAAYAAVCSPDLETSQHG